MKNMAHLRFATALIAFFLFVFAGQTVKSETFTVTSLSDSGIGSLREAILLANNNPGPDVITFDVAGAIDILSDPLPALSDDTGPTKIDGSTAPGFYGVPTVIISGPANYSVDTGLEITSADNIVHALQISGFLHGLKITGAAASGNVLTGSYIGTDGVAEMHNFIGIEITDAPNNRVGTNSDGIDDVSERNIIVGDRVAPIQITGQTATGNIIAGNFIGTNDTGTLLIGSGGIAIQSEDNLVGGTGPGAGNLILGSLFLSSSNANGNVVQGNYFGTDVTGTMKLHAGSISIYDGSNNLIGGTEPGARNIITNSVEIRNNLPYINASNNIVQGNYIGTDVTGTIGFDGGVLIVHSSNNTIGGTIPEARNIISGGTGISIYGSLYEGNATATGNIVKGNFIGTDVTGTVALSNENGISFIGNGVSGNIIGGHLPGEGNLISGNVYDGIRLLQGAFENVVQGNLIGTDVTGTIPLPNGVDSAEYGDGIDIWGHRNVIGGSEQGAGNVIAANGSHGIKLYALVEGPYPTGNIIKGNYIGTDSSGTIPMGNGRHGIWTGSARDTIIGGENPGEGNVIAYNGFDGVFVFSGTGTAILSNSIHSNIGFPGSLSYLGLGINLNASGSAILAERDSGAQSASAGTWCSHLRGKTLSKPSNGQIMQPDTTDFKYD